MTRTPAATATPTAIATTSVLIAALLFPTADASAARGDEPGRVEGRPGRPAAGASAPHPGSAAPARDFDHALMEGMSRMDAEMTAAPMTGDPDHDLAAMMIPHHQGAIDMARVFLLHGKDPTLRRLASEIIVTQGQEIDVMRRRLGSLEADAGRPSEKTGRRPTAPRPTAPATRSSGDRVYTADQTSNTVSVIDPGSNQLLGVIRLGDPLPGALSPLYRGQLLVHGMGFSPDHHTLVAVSVGSNSLSFIDTATSKVRAVVYVGRSPHEAFFTPDGREVWATVRGEEYVSVIDARTLKELRRVHTANGPSMVLFRPDGRFAFVPSSFTPELDVVDTRTYQVVARVPQASPFSPNLAVSADGKEVWFTLKDSGKTQLMSAEPPFQVLATLDTGPISNHVALVDNAKGRFAYVTVGGENVVKVFERGATPRLLATIPTGDLPHGIWGSGDGARVYVGLENQDAVAAIDTATNTVVATIPVGQQPQALVYVPDAVPDGAGAGTAGLTPLGEAGKAAHLTLVSAAGPGAPGYASVSVNQLGAIDLLQLAASGLKPGQTYTLWLVTSRAAPFEDRQALVTFKTNAAGAQIAQTLGPLRRVLDRPGAEAGHGAQRFLLVTRADGDAPELVQRAP